MTAPRAAGDLGDVAAWFKLLGDPTRLRVLYRLLDAGTLTVGEIAASVDISDSAVSSSLRLLRVAGVVVSERRGRTVQYHLADEHVRLLLEVARSPTHHRR